jgi:hypothetical protein
MVRPQDVELLHAGCIRLSAAVVTLYHSWLYNPRKGRLTLSHTSTGCLFLALGRLCQALPAFYRCEQYKLPR